MRLCTATCTRIQWSNKKSWANKPPEYIAVSCIQTRWCQPTKQSFKCAGLGHLVLESFLGSSPIAANAWGKNYHLFTSSVFFGQKQNGRTMAPLSTWTDLDIACHGLQLGLRFSSLLPWKRIAVPHMPRGVAMSSASAWSEGNPTLGHLHWHGNSQVSLPSTFFDRSKCCTLVEQ
jgi:hypothetical protein